MRNVLIIYHGDCPDGFSGAWAAWKKLGTRAEYFAAKRSLPLPSVKGKEVYCIDFTPRPKEVMEKIAKESSRLVCIDHHISAEPLLPLAHESIFSIEHSGAVLAWQYFHPKQSVPELLKYIEDTDIWKFKLPHSKEMSAYIALYDFDFKVWEKLAREFEGALSRKRILKEGTAVLRYKEKVVEELGGKAREVKFEGRKVLAANSPILQSELGHALALKHPPFAIVWREQEGMISVSLRSDGNVDVSKIAAKYGGGGHKAAAGFNIPLGKKLPWK